MSAAANRPFGIGADLCPVARIAKALPRIGRRAFTPGELRAAQGRADAAEFLAGRWAAKEAILKALGTGIAGVAPMNEIEILNGSRGAPVAKLSAAAAKRVAALGAGTIHLSISHAGGFALAFCWIERRAIPSGRAGTARRSVAPRRRSPRA